MGQKVKPIGLRLGINRTWDSRWYANKKDYGNLLVSDFKIRKYLKQKLPQAGIAKIVIERPAKKAVVSIHTSR
ncbi:MAG: 30S ribosomal protein S3, partial [Caedimonadaceae bacterium]